MVDPAKTLGRFGHGCLGPFQGLAWAAKAIAKVSPIGIGSSSTVHRPNDYIPTYILLLPTDHYHRRHPSILQSPPYAMLPQHAARRAQSHPGTAAAARGFATAGWRCTFFLASPFVTSTRQGPRAHGSRLDPLSREAPFTFRPNWHQTTKVRGVKRKATVDLELVPQGLLPVNPEELPPTHDLEPDYPPLLQQVRNNMLRFSHCVILTRVGGFYEVTTLLSCCRSATLTVTQLYFEHADEYAPLLNLKKSKKKAVRGSKRPAVSMVRGRPTRALYPC